MNIRYYRKDDRIEYIFYRNAAQSYPMHTHTSHVTAGYVLDGAVRVSCGAERFVCHAGEVFFMPPDVPHALAPADGAAYSMLCVCALVPQMPKEAQNGMKRLKQLMLAAPETAFSTEAMARCAGFSRWHMLRQFRAVCGLSPHQFLIQCRVRKAQRLLEEGKSVTETAYAAGFCDQSHLDRCFRRIVRMTPSAYRRCVYVSGNSGKTP